ncbi:MAG: hypothetical protein EON51_02240 [Acinetobacter sp.]|nr:MAG: hypothetical protein EON51_02240 [Acinetobacter sp.]
MEKVKILRLISGLLATLFFYAALSKLIDFHKSLGEMRNQIFPPMIADTLTWLIPLLEITLAVLLLFPKTNKLGLWGSFFLLLAFTFYIIIILAGFFGQIPCSCGGVLKNMSYLTHLFFNLFFLAVSLLGMAIENDWKINNKMFNNKKERT